MLSFIGKINALQLLVMAFIEVMFYSFNLGIGINGLTVIDIGGGIFIHTFGAFFGSTMIFKNKYNIKYI